MRERAVTRVVDALQSQDRYIIWLECHHRVSLSLRQLQANPTIMAQLHEAEKSKRWLCPFCAPPDPEEVRQEKSATQLWKEAGEP